MPDVKCKVCKKQFYVKPYHIKLGYGKYCSKDCQNQGQRTGRFIICETCGKEDWKMQKQIRHSKSKKFFCSKSCQTIWRNQFYVGTKHPNWQGGEFTYHRIMKKHGAFPKCTKCGLEDKRVLLIHHVDHNRKNNVIGNLMWLCRNCHYLIHNGKTF